MVVYNYYTFDTVRYIHYKHVYIVPQQTSAYHMPYIQMFRPYLGVYRNCYVMIDKIGYVDMLSILFAMFEDN
jgi:hypothetical protein